MMPFSKNFKTISVSCCCKSCCKGEHDHLKMNISDFSKQMTRSISFNGNSLGLFSPKHGKVSMFHSKVIEMPGRIMLGSQNCFLEVVPFFVPII